MSAQGAPHRRAGALSTLRSQEGRSPGTMVCENAQTLGLAPAGLYGNMPTPMITEVRYCEIPLNLPHAGRIAYRIARVLHSRHADGSDEANNAMRAACALVELLDPWLELDENPPGQIGLQIRDKAAALGRRLVDHIERGGLGGDRLGECVRNLFECFELGREGALISLRAGENPLSLQRPR